MQITRVKQTLYKHADLVANLLFEMTSIINGFSLGLNLDIPEQRFLSEQSRSDFLGIFLVTKGEITFEVNFEQYILVKNNLIIVSPYSIKKMVSATPGSLLSVISFTADFMTELGISKNITDILDYFTSQFQPNWELSTKDAALFSSMLGLLKKRCIFYEKHLHGKELLYHQFYIFLYEMSAMSKRYVTLGNSTTSRKENLFVSFTKLVQHQFKSLRKVQDYAAQLNVSAKHLSETVKEVSGKTAGDIIDNFVQLEAKLLLQNHDLSIAQIANTLNFSDQSFFGKFFKRETGLSPKDYRKSLHGFKRPDEK